MGYVMRRIRMAKEQSYTEIQACLPHSLRNDGFNTQATLPYGLQITHLQQAMQDFLDFLGFINTQLNTKGIERLEKMLMPANFSSVVGEFMTSALPKYCNTIVKNRYHNGHPDLIPVGHFANDAVQHSETGIEVKASRYLRGWQGHNPEDVWLMIFAFDCNRSKDTKPYPFRFVRVVGAQLTKADWLFSGRSETSRRTITASVKQSGFEKLMENRLYEGLETGQI
jgi:hypothetical protein